MRPDGTRNVVITDHLGSTRLTLSTDAAPMQRQLHNAFGEVTSDVGEGARTGYIGREHDVESDLGFYGVRLYEPEYGRFMSTDPLWGMYLDQQPYHYTRNSPKNRTDRSGLFDIDEHVMIDRIARTIVGENSDLEEAASLAKHVLIDGPGFFMKNLHVDSKDNPSMQEWLESGGYDEAGDHTRQDFYCHSNYVEVMSQLGFELDKIPTLDALKCERPDVYKQALPLLQSTDYPNVKGGVKNHDLDEKNSPLQFKEVKTSGGTPWVFTSKHNDHPKPAMYGAGIRLAIEATVIRKSKTNE